MKSKGDRMNWSPDQDRFTPKGTKAVQENGAKKKHQEMLDKQERLRNLNPLNL